MTEIKLLPDSVSGNRRKALVERQTGTRAALVSIIARVVCAIVEKAPRRRRVIRVRESWRGAQAVVRHH